MKNQSEVLWELRSMRDHIDWDSVYTAELPRIYNFFLYKVGDKEIAQDLTAATFERAWVLRSRYQKTIAALTTWLFGIARNVFKEYLRKYRMRARRLVSMSPGEAISTNVDIEKNVQQQQEKEKLRRILLELPDRQQNLIALKYGAGLTNREIAKITNLSESNVGSILHRAVKSIRTRWEHDHER